MPGVLSVRNMTFSDYLDHSPRVDHLQGFDRQLALASGMSPQNATAWAQLEHIYFGNQRHSKQQGKALRRAREGKFSVEQLAMIERRLKHIEHEGTRWQLRLQLLRHVGRYKSLEKAAQELIPKEKPPRKESMRFSKSEDGMRSCHIVAPERFLADLEALLSADLDKSLPPGPQLLANFIALLHDGSRVPTAAPTPLLLVPLDVHRKILQGEGDDTVLGMTDGTTMTGAEYLNLELAEELNVALFHPHEGAVNLYRGERLANEKQRVLAKATSPVCLVPDCRHGAEASEVHHIQAWKRGGETNMSNLAVLCRYHNRTNDDDPGAAKRGRIEVIDGRPVWVSPRGYIVPNTYHPFGAMNQLFGPAFSPAAHAG